MLNCHFSPAFYQSGSYTIVRKKNLSLLIFILFNRSNVMKSYNPDDLFFANEPQLNFDSYEKLSPELKSAVDYVYNKLKTKTIYPAGRFDSAGRFYAKNSFLNCIANVRSPSRAYPYSELRAATSRKYVVEVLAYFRDFINCANDLERLV